jgi:hypothetical protein
MNMFKVRNSGGKLLVLVSFTLAFQGILGASSANASCISVNDMEVISNGNGTYVTCGGDDLSYRIPIAGSVVFGGVTYTSIYATGNSVITFGVGDGTYWEFPQTPSISLDAQDWVQDGYASNNGSNANQANPDRADEFFNITVAGETFRVDISARPYSTYSADYSITNGLVTYVPQGNPTRLSFSFARNTDGTLRIATFTSDATDANLRNGCVLSQGATPISLSACGIYEVATLEALVFDNKTDYLVATTPLLVSESKDQVICTSAKLNYMIQGVQAEAAQLTSQTYSLNINGVSVAHKSTLDKSATFEKKLIPTTGTVTCSQVETQNGSQVTVESTMSATVKDAAKTRKAEVDKVNAVFNAEAKKLLETKLSHLAAGDMKKYSEASAQWKAALDKAQQVRDLAVSAALAKEAKAPYEAGMKIELKP